MNALANYYAKRAPEYERIYQKPERQADLRALREFVARTFAERRVLEVACGTGWWTDVLANSARSVIATDINDETLAIAKAKRLNCDTVSFQRCDAFRLDELAGDFDAAFSAFWWSHLTRLQLKQFLARLHHRLQPGRIVMFIDNLYVEGSSTPISRRDEQGNTYQMRKLNDGSTTEVLKNFPTDETIAETLCGCANDLNIKWLTYYWHARYTVPNPQSEIVRAS